MSPIIVDPATEARLVNLNTPVELCAASGRVLGRFLPAFNKEDWENLEPTISDEELERREREGGGRSLAEIWADLDKRA